MLNNPVSQTKTNAKQQSANSKHEISNGIDREEMISVAAYFRAQNRGLDGGDSHADWLAAEAEFETIYRNQKRS